MLTWFLSRMTIHAQKTPEEIAKATGGKVTTAWVANGVSIDTRTIQKGDLFVALSAARDGHEFVAQALEQGASAALVSRIPDGMDESAPLIIVEDVLDGLEALGRAARDRTDARIVAVTGSVGKTSTKEMLCAILGDQGKTHASVASYNNHWGCAPLHWLVCRPIRNTVLSKLV